MLWGHHLVSQSDALSWDVESGLSWRKVGQDSMSVSILSELLPAALVSVVSETYFFKLFF